MNKVNVRREELLTVLKENREKHIADFEKAVEGFRTEVVEQAKRNVAIAKKIAAEVAKDPNYRPQRMSEPLDVHPVSYETYYNKAIRMVELSADEIIELEAEVFDQLVMDEWIWKQNFTVSTAKYLG